MSSGQIRDLHQRASQIIKDEGYLNGGDVAELIERWFIEIGQSLPQGDD